MSSKLLLFAIVFFVLIFSSCNVISAQDIIHKKDEKIIAAKVILIDSVNIYYKEITNLSGPTVQIAKSAVSHIRFDYSNSTKNNYTNKKANYIRAKNAVSFGLGGTGGFLSFNYDRIVFETPNFFISAKGGLGSWLSQTNFNFHITGNHNFGGTKHYLEFGLGAALAFGQFDKYHRYYASVPIIGYRYQPKSEGLFFRSYACGYVMIQDINGVTLFLPMSAIELGFTF
jgi:hypothetical protein